MRLSGGNIRFLAADEPTSALDPEGEFELFKKLKKHRGEKTVVFITHRLATARRADKIAMMEHGVRHRSFPLFHFIFRAASSVGRSTS